MPFHHDEQHGEREHWRMHDAYDATNFRPDEILAQMAKHLQRHTALRLMLRQADVTRDLLCWAGGLCTAHAPCCVLWIAIC